MKLLKISHKLINLDGFLKLLIILYFFIHSDEYDQKYKGLGGRLDIIENGKE